MSLYKNCQAISFLFTSPHYKPCLHKYEKEFPTSLKNGQCYKNFQML